MLPRSSKAVSHAKYLIDCDHPESSFTHLRKLKTDSQHLILAAIHAATSKTPRQVVVKLYAPYEKHHADAEYAISQRLPEHFLKFLCKIECEDDLSEYYKPLKNKRMCVPGTKYGSLTTILVSKYFTHGPLKANMTKLPLHVFKSCLLQVVGVIISTFDTHGFLHKDLHSLNVLLVRTSKTTLDLHEYGIVPLYGYRVIITDFELSSFADPKTAEDYEQLLWDIHSILTNVRTPTLNGFNEILKDLADIINSNTKFDLRTLWQRLSSAINNLHPPSP